MAELQILNKLIEGAGGARKGAAVRIHGMYPVSSHRKKYMINYEEEIKRFKPSLDVDQIEDAIAKVDLTDMNDIMTSLIEEAIDHKKDESAR